MTATSLSVTPTNPTTNGYYSSAPTVSFTGTGTSGVTDTVVLTNGRVTSVTIGGTTPSGLIIPTSVGNVTVVVVVQDIMLFQMFLSQVEVVQE